MSDESIYLVVRSVDGLVVNAAVGEPVPADGQETVAREGLATDAWIGWIRQPDGTFTAPDAESDLEA